MNGKRVVVAPLDWGLGHATRCIPIIQALRLRGCEVWIASSGSALTLLKNEFPSLSFTELPSYRANYSRSLPLMISVFLQIPKFLMTIYKEHRQMKLFCMQHQIDLVISDNRYGCWVKNGNSVFITHQINILMPGGLKWLEPVIRYFNHRFIKQFSFCWVPDQPGTNNLSGLLSKSSSLPVRYIGILSRFKNWVPNLERESPAGYEIAVVLSGPEPQRSLLEKKLMSQLIEFPGKTILIRGVVEEQTLWTQKGNLSIVNYLTSEKLALVMKDSQLIIARSGYSTVMDLAVLGKKTIFIPTPGQTEQEYLAKRFMDSSLCFTIEQKGFDLKFALKQSEGFSGFSNIERSNDLIEQALTEVLSL